MLRGGKVKEIYELKGRGYPARAIAERLGLARNTVLKHLNSPEPLTAQPRPLRGSRLDPYTDYIDQRVSEGLENCRVLLREIRGLGYEGRLCPCWSSQGPAQAGSRQGGDDPDAEDRQGLGRQGPHPGHQPDEGSYRHCPFGVEAGLGTASPALPARVGGPSAN